MAMIPFDDRDFLQDPYPVLNAVREEAPLFKQPQTKDGQEIWFLTRHDDVHRTLRDRRLGRVMTHDSWDESVPSDPALKPYFDIEKWSLLQLEPPEHTRIRSLLSREFTPKRVAALEPRIRAIVDQLLEQIDTAGFDLLTEFAQPFSLLVMCELLGAPFEDRALLLDWSHRIVKMYELDTTPEQVASAVSASQDFAAWTRELIAERKARPKNDLISGLCTVETDEGTLTDDEIISTVILLLNAGHEATVNTLGNGVTALMNHPEEWKRLRDGDVPATSAVEELLRFDSPLQLFERVVLVDDFEVAGQRIPCGDKVAMLFGSANRDPRKWSHPNRFDIARADPTHVTFGSGLHHCIGAPLARLEIGIALERLVARCPSMTLVDQPVRHNAFVIHGYRAVNMRLA